jgi:glycerate dehydrogenase
MRIVVLDGYTLNPGDLSWDPLRDLGPCEIYDRTPPDCVKERVGEAEAVLTNKVVLDEALFSACSGIQYVGVLATGVNVVDIEAAHRRNIVVTNVPDYSTRSVAQHVFAHILNLSIRVGDHARSVRRGDWVRCQDFSYCLHELIELADKKMGIIGMGRIGTQVAALAHAFGMDVLYYTRSKVGEVPGARSVPLESLVRESDIISLHCPLTEDTHQLMNAERIGWMKSGAFLINTGRGLLVEESALADALNDGRLGGAGLDVLATEPPLRDNPLLTAKNCFITPHIAWATRESRSRLLQAVVDNLKAFIGGAATNVVD